MSDPPSSFFCFLFLMADRAHLLMIDLESHIDMLNSRISSLSVPALCQEQVFQLFVQDRALWQIW